MILKSIEDNRARLGELEKKKIYFLVDVPRGIALHDIASNDELSRLFKNEDHKTVARLLRSSFVTELSRPVLFDLKKTVDFFKKGRFQDDAHIEFSFLMSRVNFMGTDGIRGKISTDTSKSCLEEILVHNVLVPGLIENCTYAFASLLADQRILNPGDTVCVGNDGRDRTTDWQFKNAAIDGFTKAGVNVLDLGIIPTPFVPYKMLKHGHRAGAMLTASHNPANQNGIKLFLDSKKILPEGPTGDFAFSAYIFDSVRRKACATSAKTGRVSAVPRFEEECAELVLSLLPSNTGELLGSDVIVLDDSNGAFAGMAATLLDRLQLRYVPTNPEPDGYNINKECGVAELEGETVFLPDQMDAHNPFIKAVFEQGRAHADRNVFGVALDGDGDRGFVVFYEKADDCVHVVDGDKSGFILARYFLEHGASKSAYFVSTIESDLMTAISAADVLGMNTKIVSVGDKWIGHFDDGPLCIGLEVTGHLIFPVEIVNDAGDKVVLLAGNGFYTCLLCLVAIKELNLEGAEIYHPFEAGYSKTIYRFFVDKSKFVRESDVWNKDIQIIRGKIAQYVENGSLPPDTAVTFEQKEDVNVLYGSIRDGKKLIGCIISRNSGTEDKNAVYALGKKEKADILCDIGKAVNRNHLTMMKNRDRIEYVYENTIMNILRTNDSISEETLMAEVKRRTNKEVKKVDFDGVLHGLKKEERIAVEDGAIRLVSLD